VGLLLLTGVEVAPREEAPHPRHTLPCSLGTAQRYLLVSSSCLSLPCQPEQWRNKVLPQQIQPKERQHRSAGNE